MGDFIHIENGEKSGICWCGSGVKVNVAVYSISVLGESFKDICPECLVAIRNSIDRKLSAMNPSASVYPALCGNMDLAGLSYFDLCLIAEGLGISTKGWPFVGTQEVKQALVTLLESRRVR